MRNSASGLSFNIRRNLRLFALDAIKCGADVVNQRVSDVNREIQGRDFLEKQLNLLNMQFYFILRLMF